MTVSYFSLIRADLMVFLIRIKFTENWRIKFYVLEIMLLFRM